ncbi:MAG: hypothetical protein ACR2PF_21160 [Rhizobiaceae bacterium]
MTAIAQFLPDFSEESLTPAEPINTFVPFGTAPAEGCIWQELFAQEGEVEDTAGVLIDGPFDTANENAIPDADNSDPVLAQHQPQIELIPKEEHEEVIRDLEKHYEDLIDELKQAYREQVLRSLEELKTQAIDRLARELETEVAQALIPFGQKCLAEKAAQHLATEIAEILSEKPNLQIYLSGPQDLIDSVVNLLGEEAELVKTEITHQAELKLETDGKVIRTAIGNWTERLDGVLNA